jgi:hypothetical protein
LRSVSSSASSTARETGASSAKQAGTADPDPGTGCPPKSGAHIAGFLWGAKERAAQSLPKQAADDLHAVVPIELEAVVAGLRDAAKKGSAPAARELLNYLTRFPVQGGSETVRMDKPLEEMTPEELAFADAYLVRRINRAQRIAAARKKKDESGALRPHSGGQTAGGDPPEA